MSMDNKQIQHESQGNRIVLSHNGLKLIGELKRNSIEERKLQSQASMLLAQSRWQESRVNRIKALEPMQDSHSQQEQLKHLLLESVQDNERQNKYVLKKIEKVATKAARFSSTPIDLNKNTDRNNSRSSIVTENYSFNLGIGSSPGTSSLFPGIRSPKRQRTNKSISSINNKTLIASESPSSTLPVISPQEIRKKSRNIEAYNQLNIINNYNNGSSSTYHKRYSSNDSFAITNKQVLLKQYPNSMNNQGITYDQDQRQSLNTIWQQNKPSQLTNSNKNYQNNNQEPESHRSMSTHKNNGSIGNARNNLNSNVSFLSNEGSQYNNSLLFNSPRKPTEDDSSSSFSKQYSYLLNAESALERMMQRKQEAESVYQRIQTRLKQKMKTSDEQLDGSQADSSDIKTHITDKELLEPLFRTTNYQVRFQNRLRQRQHEKFETHWNIFHLGQKQKQQIIGRTQNEGIKQHRDNSQNNHKKLGGAVV